MKIALPTVPVVEPINDRVECFDLVVNRAEFDETVLYPNMRGKSRNQGQYRPRHNLGAFDDLVNAIPAGTFFDELRGDIAVSIAKPRAFADTVLTINYVNHSSLLQLHPLVLPQVSHFMQVPLRTKVKFPQEPQASPS